MEYDLLEYKPVVEEYLRDTPAVLSSHSFVSLFTWKDFFEFGFKVIDDALCIFATHEAGTFLYLPPLAKDLSPAVIDTCFADMHERNQGRGVSRIENLDERLLPLFPTEKFFPYCKGYEYYYYRQDLAALAGNDYKSKRSSYNHFCKNYWSAYRPYSPEMQKKCLELYDAWSNRRKEIDPDPVAVQMLEENRSVHRLVMEHDEALEIVGRVVEVDGELKAYTFGYRLNDQTFCVVLEIADWSVQGLAVYIFREFCADVELKKYKFINVMDDFAMDEVKQTKLSFKPRSAKLTSEKDPMSSSRKGFSN